MDRLESMEVFVEVADAGSLSAAARRRGLSPTMVGKHLRALEARMGVSLLQRTTRRQRLTEAGELYLERCRAVLDRVAEAEDAAAALRGAPAGLLRIGAPISFGVATLAPALADFLGQHPRVDVELMLSDEPADPVGDGLDAAFRVGPLADTRLIARPLAPYRMAICAAPDYLARRGNPAYPRDLADHDCLGLTHWGLRHVWRLNGPEGGVEVQVQYRARIDSGPALREAALSGAGIIMQPLALVQADLADGRLLRVLPDYETRTRPHYLVYVRDRTPPAKLSAFAAFALARFSGP